MYITAYQYFVENKNNKNRRICQFADFEFIPLLPLAWRGGVSSSTMCTAGMPLCIYMYVYIRIYIRIYIIKYRIYLYIHM
jgi:hypothetical protein